jgi:hypothetical protein
VAVNRAASLAFALSEWPRHLPRRYVDGRGRVVRNGESVVTGRYGSDTTLQYSGSSGRNAKEGFDVRRTRKRFTINGLGCDMTTTETVAIAVMFAMWVWFVALWIRWKKKNPYGYWSDR